MIIAVASGKGGTGKTTVAVNLAMALPGEVQLLDCDVEEPNANLFLRAAVTEREEVHMEVPLIDNQACTYCGKCREICRFNAVAIVPETRVALAFPELCHGCGGCFAVCPEGAVLDSRRLLGVVEKGKRSTVKLVQGRLRVGEAMAPPLIRKVVAQAEETGITVVDAPPGTSCPVVTSLRRADCAVLVTEPTPFGLNDLELAAGAVRKMGIPAGIVVNRCDVGDGRIRDFARREGIPILLEIPFDRAVAEAYARGELLVERFPRWKERMLHLHSRIQGLLVPE
ncbi:MAG TPA: ATP-binding protein [Syntrophobacteraceae bacterium]|nr:ATP-binding protein [Syntrophobacteraceae bacterium]